MFNWDRVSVEQHSASNLWYITDGTSCIKNDGLEYVSLVDKYGFCNGLFLQKEYAETFLNKIRPIKLEQVKPGEQFYFRNDDRVYTVVVMKPELYFYLDSESRIHQFGDNKHKLVNKV